MSNPPQTYNLDTVRSDIDALHRTLVSRIENLSRSIDASMGAFRDQLSKTDSHVSELQKTLDSTTRLAKISLHRISVLDVEIRRTYDMSSGANSGISGVDEKVVRLVGEAVEGFQRLTVCQNQVLSDIKSLVNHMRVVYGDVQEVSRDISSMKQENTDSKNRMAGNMSENLEEWSRSQQELAHLNLTMKGMESVFLNSLDLQQLFLTRILALLPTQKQTITPPEIPAS